MSHALPHLTCVHPLRSELEDGALEAVRAAELGVSLPATRSFMHPRRPSQLHRRRQRQVAHSKHAEVGEEAHHHGDANGAGEERDSGSPPDSKQQEVAGTPLVRSHTMDPMLSAQHRARRAASLSSQPPARSPAQVTVPEEEEEAEEDAAQEATPQQQQAGGNTAIAVAMQDNYFRADANSTSVRTAMEGVAPVQVVVQDAEGSYRNRFSVAEIDAVVVKARCDQSGRSKYVLYAVEVGGHVSRGTSMERKTYIVWRRFSEFKALHTTLAKRFSSSMLPKFPPSTLFKSFDPAFIATRKEALDKYTCGLLRMCDTRVYSGGKMAHSGEALDSDPDLAAFFEALPATSVRMHGDVSGTTSSTGNTGLGDHALFASRSRRGLRVGATPRKPASAAHPDPRM